MFPLSEVGARRRNLRPQPSYIFVMPSSESVSGGRPASSVADISPEYPLSGRSPRGTLPCPSRRAFLTPLIPGLTLRILRLTPVNECYVTICQLAMWLPPKLRRCQPPASRFLTLKLGGALLPDPIPRDSTGPFQVFPTAIPGSVPPSFEAMRGPAVHPWDGAECRESSVMPWGIRQ